jgi:hypothetical protein
VKKLTVEQVRRYPRALTFLGARRRRSGWCPPGTGGTTRRPSRRSPAPGPRRRRGCGSSAPRRHTAGPGRAARHARTGRCAARSLRDRTLLLRGRPRHGYGRGAVSSPATAVPRRCAGDMGWAVFASRPPGSPGWWW